MRCAACHSSYLFNVRTAIISTGRAWRAVADESRLRLPETGTDALKRLTLLRSLSCRGIDTEAARCLTSMHALTSLDCWVFDGKSFCSDVLPRLTRLIELTLGSVDDAFLLPDAFSNLTLVRKLRLSDSGLRVGDALLSVTPSLTSLSYCVMPGSDISFRHLTALTTLECSWCNAE